MDERAAAELVSVEGRLMAGYGPSLGPDAETRCIADAVNYFNERRYAPNVLLLVERRAIAQLRDEARRAAADTGDGQGRLS